MSCDWSARCRPIRSSATTDAGGRGPDPIHAAWGAGGPPEIKYHGQPVDDAKPTLLWDGEWEVTYVTFRDMGAAFMVAILGIYLLVVAQFRSFLLPLVILVPVPLTLIGIVLGHLDARCPLHRNLNDRLYRTRRHHRAQLDLARGLHSSPARRGRATQRGPARGRGDPLRADLPHGRRRDDWRRLHPDGPHFPGLAISLVFGLASSTVLTVLVIPAIYVWFRGDSPATC